MCVLLSLPASVWFHFDLMQLSTRIGCLLTSTEQQVDIPSLSWHDNWSSSEYLLSPEVHSCNYHNFPSIIWLAFLLIWVIRVYSKKRIVILAMNLLCWLQMSEPVWCMDTVNWQDGMKMWRKVDWEWGKDWHVVILHIFVHSSESEITVSHHDNSFFTVIVDFSWGFGGGLL